MRSETQKRRAVVERNAEKRRRRYPGPVWGGLGPEAWARRSTRLLKTDGVRPSGAHPHGSQSCTRKTWRRGGGGGDGGWGKNMEPRPRRRSLPRLHCRPRCPGESACMRRLPAEDRRTGGTGKGAHFHRKQFTSNFSAFSLPLLKNVCLNKFVLRRYSSSRFARNCAEIIFLHQCAGVKDILSVGPNHQTSTAHQKN